jgi:hypothetical protein
LYQNGILTGFLICAGQRLEIKFGLQNNHATREPVMIRKTILTLAALLAISALGTSPARADIDIDINLGFGGGYLGKVSCGTGARIVDRRFNRVVARDCRGSHYQYTGFRNGKWYRITLNSRTARIVAIRRWWR